MVEQRTENPRVPSSILGLGTISVGAALAREHHQAFFWPKWRNRQTRQSQKLLRGDSRVGSSPTFGTIMEAQGAMPYQVPSCVVVARGTLNPLALVRIQARQPYTPR